MAAFRVGAVLVALWALAAAQSSLTKPKLYSLHVDSRIAYRYANTTVEARLANPANVSQEVSFSMVLPDTAFISGFTIETDGKAYEAYVREKAAAQQEYQQAVAQGQTAAHVAVSARDSNAFTVSVNLEPGKKATFRLRYEELLLRKLGAYTHVINLHPGQLVPDLKVDVYIKESSNITELNVPNLRSGNEVIENESGTQNSIATVERTGDKTAHISFAPTLEQQKELGLKKTSEDKNVEGIGGQFVVQYDVTREPYGEVLVDEGYFVHFFAPEELPPLHKHVIFVLDVSGSMEGRKIEQLKEAMNVILDDLKPGDYFNILEFSYSVTVWNLNETSLSSVYTPYGIYENKTENMRQTPAFPVTPDHVNKAKEIINKMTAGGGTNIHDALKVAIDVCQRGFQNGHVSGINGPPEPIIIFLTDGEPTVGESRPNKIYSSISELNHHPAAAIFSLAFGNDADLNFLKRLSLKNDGFARKIYEASDAALQLRDFYRQVASPLLANVTFSYPPGQVDDDSVTKQYFPTLFSGSELVVAGKLDDEHDSNLTAEVSGHGLNGDSIFPILQPWLVEDVPLEGSRKNASSLERLWAYLTIQQLLEDDEIARAQDDPFDEMSNTTDGKGNNTKTLKQRALDLALQYSFVTRLTSLVVVKPNDSSDATSQILNSDGNQQNAAFGVADRFAAGLPLAMAMPGRPFHYLTTKVSHISTSISGLQFQESTTDVADSVAANNSSQVTRLVSLNDVVWLADATNGTNTLNIPVGVNGTLEDYKIGFNEADQVFEVCNYPESQNRTSHCRHLPYCVLSAFTTDVTQYSPYFCRIGEFAGVCCPDDIHIPSTTTVTTSPVTASSDAPQDSS